MVFEALLEIKRKGGLPKENWKNQHFEEVARRVNEIRTIVTPKNNTSV
jgi:hypothetical protein